MKKNLQKIAIAIATVSLMNLLTFTSVQAQDSSIYSQKLLSDVGEEKVVGSSEGDYGLAKDIKDGVILHAFCWSFNTIKNNMKEIAEAGYTSVQTSPANECFKGDGGGLAFGKPGNKGQGGGGCWYYHYQPTDFKIGNYQLGTRDDFKAMCDEAKKYGVKIIVDVVANHSTEYEDNIAQSLKNISGGLYHTTGHQGINNYGDRFQCTQQGMCNGGLPDINTENKAYQNYLMEYLKDCLACGASGFRYDAAKHIGLPDDPNGGDFWPTILKNGAEFQYGEVLQGDNERFGSYASYLGVTASDYGKSIRAKAGSKNLEAGGISNYCSSGVGADKLVTWAESHDNYCNDDGCTAGMSDDVVRIAWGCLAARQGTTPLFFSRPVGSGGSGKPKFSEQTKMGDKGSDFFKDPAIAGVNKFRNAMVGEGENLSNCGNDCLVVARGSKGVAFINAGDSKDVEAETSMTDGKYKDQVSGNEFTVSSGKMKGKVGGNTIACVYKADDSAKTDTKTEDKNEDKKEDMKTDTKTNSEKTTGTNVAYLKLPEGWTEAYAYVYNNTPDAPKGAAVKENAKWPGVEMTKVSDGLYKYEIPTGYDNPLIIFNNGAQGTANLKYPSDSATEVDAEGLVCTGSMICDGASWKAYDDATTKKEEDTTKKEDTKKEEDTTKKEDTKKEEDTKKKEDTKKEEDTTKKEDTKKEEDTTKKEEDTDKKEDVSNLSVSLKSSGTTAYEGDSIKFTATASNASGTVKYLFKVNGQAKGTFKTTKTFNWEAEEAGTYKVIVVAKDNNKEIKSKEVKVVVSKNKEEKQEDKKQYLSIDNFKIGKTSPQEVGKSIKLSATASGGNGEYQYKFYEKKNGKTTVISDYSDSSSATWKPTAEGTYTVYVSIKDDDGTIESSSKSFTIESNSEESDDQEADSFDNSNIMFALSTIAAAGIMTLNIKKKKNYNK